MKARTLNAEAKYGYGGKQFVARITGRDPKFTFKREFVGKKSGKRGDFSSAMVDEPGLYQTRDIDRKGGADDTYYVLCPTGELLVIDQAQAMALAHDVAGIDYVAILIADHEERIAASDGKNPDDIVMLKNEVGPLQPGEVRRGDVIAARRAELARLRGAGPSPTKADELRGEAAALRARLEEIEALLAGLDSGCCVRVPRNANQSKERLGAELRPK